MKTLKTGQFFGSHFQKINFNDFIVTDTEYTHEKVDWHYHENPYFTYLLQGKLYEANKKKEYFLQSGDLVFHNWQDAHHNIKPPEYTRGFHLELSANWLSKYDVSLTDFEGSFHLENPIIKSLINQLFWETKINDVNSKLSIEALILSVFETIKAEKSTLKNQPDWLQKIPEIIIDTNKNYSLTSLSEELNIHPTHLSRSFHKYFGTTLGQYIRKVRLNKAIILMFSNRFSMTEICYQCGFYDQSHFISCFKVVYKTTPLQFCKKVL